jgi:hypothetical protein
VAEKRCAAAEFVVDNEAGLYTRDPALSQALESAWFQPLNL